jgi:vacuolar protein sorting-associated protein 33B
MEGLEGLVALHRFSWDFVKLDKNLLSLELPNIFRDLFVKGDKSLLSSIANSLRIFNMVHGKPKFILSYGENSANILSMVNQMENLRKSSTTKEYPDFNGMIIMDRDKDYPSCLLTPVTYSGLMIELFETRAGILSIDIDNNKIKSGRINFLKEETKESIDDETKNLRMCGTSDELYTYNKYRHFTEVVNLIKSESKSLEEVRSKYKRDMNIEQMKEFVEQNLPKVSAQKKVLFKHLVICEKIVQELSGNFERQQNFEEIILKNGNKKQILAFIDEQLHTNAHQWNILRLICLYHVCIGGLNPDETNKFVCAYLNTFGHKNLNVFHNLMRAKLFPDITRVASKNLIEIAQSTLAKKTQFQVDASKLRLFPGDENDIATSKEKNITKACPSYVFNGNFIPLVAQLTDNLLKAENFHDFNNKVGHLENLKISLNGSDLQNLKDLTGKNNVKSFPLMPKSLFIFIIGGITYAEVAACNMIESLTGSKIVLASDRILSGVEIVKSANC